MCEYYEHMCEHVLILLNTKWETKVMLLIMLILKHIELKIVIFRQKIDEFYPVFSNSTPSDSAIQYRFYHS